MKKSSIRKSKNKAKPRNYLLYFSKHKLLR
jgi:hypothetical protein